MIVYRIYDTELKEYINGQKSNVFVRAGAAKVSCAQKFMSPWDKTWPRVDGSRVSFNDQTRFEIHKFELVRVVT